MFCSGDGEFHLCWSCLAMVLAVLGLVMAFVVYMGVFRKMTCFEHTIDAFVLAYRPHIGQYYKIGSVFDKVTKTISTLKLEEDAQLEVAITSTKACEHGLSLYFDDPLAVKPQELRSLAGVVLPIAPGDVSRIAPVFEKHGLFIKAFPQTKVLATKMPYRNMLSFMLGPMKAYGALDRAFTERKETPVAPSIEMYRCDAHAKPSLLYAFPLANHEAFQWDACFPNGVQVADKDKQQ